MSESRPRDHAGCGSADRVRGSEPAIELLQATEIDYVAYSEFQREAYRDLLTRTKSTAAHMTPEMYRWKYNPPDGPARIARVSHCGETLSSSAMLPLRISFKGRSIMGWHCLDVATLPKSRRKGYFLSTLRKLMDSVPPDDLFFAFPNASSIVSFLKLGCAENRILTTWINLSARLVRRRDPKIERIDGFDPRHDIVGKGVPMERPTVTRCPAYLNWRYTDHPANSYISFAYGKDPCNGICVVRKARVMDRDLALVMEVFGSTPSIQGALLSHAADWAHRSGIRMMALMNTSLPPWTALRTCFAPVPSLFLPKRQVLVVRGRSDLARSLMQEKWTLQTGDWDVF